MSTKNPDQQNIILDKILIERRSYRQFKQEFPPEEDIRGSSAPGFMRLLLLQL